MNRFFTVFIVLVLLAAGLFAGATYWFGLEAEQRYRELLIQSPSWGTIRLADGGYERGFLTSRARTTVTLQNPAHSQQTGGKGKDAKFLQFTLDHEIDHGPWPFWRSMEKEVPLKPIQAVVATRINLAEHFGDTPTFAGASLSTTLSLAGNGEMQLSIPGVQSSFGKEGGRLDWGGLRGEMTFTRDLTGFSGFLTSPGLTVEEKDGRLESGAAVCRFDVHKGDRSLYLGDGSFSLSHLGIGDSGAEEVQFFLGGLELKTSTQASGDAVGCSVAIGFEQVRAQNRRHGPGICEMELRNLDAETLEKLQEVAQKLRAEYAYRDPEEISQVLLASFAQMLPELMKRSPELEITRLSVKTSDGDFKGKAKIAVDGTHASAFANPLFLLNALAAHAEFTASDRLLPDLLSFVYREQIMAENEQKGRSLNDERLKALANARSREVLESLVSQSVLIHENGQYRVKAEFGQGLLTLNGRALGGKGLAE